MRDAMDLAKHIDWLQCQGGFGDDDMEAIILADRAQVAAETRAAVVEEIRSQLHRLTTTYCGHDEFQAEPFVYRENIDRVLDEASGRIAKEKP